MRYLRTLGRFAGRAESIAFLMSSVAAAASILFVMWLNGLLFWSEPALAKTHFPLRCDTEISRTSILNHERAPNRDPTHLLQIQMRPLDESRPNPRIRQFTYLVKYYGDFSQLNTERCPTLDMRLPSALEDAQGSVTERASGNKIPRKLTEPQNQFDLKAYSIISTIGHTNQHGDLVRSTSFYEKRVGMSAFLGATLGADQTEKIIDIVIHLPKRFTIVRAFPDGFTPTTDSSGVNYHWIVSGNGPVFGDFWIDIQDEKRRKISDILGFAAGALLGAAVSAMYGALISLTTGRRAS